MSSESNQDPYRRRPFSVNDLNRRTREVKIFNTTTITTTTSTTSHDSTISTTTISNGGNVLEHCHPHCSNILQDLHDNQTSYTTTNNNTNTNNNNKNNKRHDCSRSKSAFTTNNEQVDYFT